MLRANEAERRRLTRAERAATRAELREVVRRAREEREAALIAVDVGARRLWQWYLLALWLFRFLDAL